MDGIDFFRRSRKFLVSSQFSFLQNGIKTLGKRQKWATVDLGVLWIYILFQMEYVSISTKAEYHICSDMGRIKKVPNITKKQWRSVGLIFSWYGIISFPVSNNRVLISLKTK